mmetsp:Transcript_16367/g.22445  ORF Transcript_16367/g.22445 Transcript_16367/m.22445 type:complete len:100 (+) Transcript_16367:656-955(+)
MQQVKKVVAFDHKISTKRRRRRKKMTTIIVTRAKNDTKSVKDGDTTVLDAQQLSVTNTVEQHTPTLQAVKFLVVVYAMFVYNQTNITSPLGARKEVCDS